jgi:hypothetical protein
MKCIFLAFCSTFFGVGFLQSMIQKETEFSDRMDRGTRRKLCFLFIAECKVGNKDQLMLTKRSAYKVELD